MKTCTLQEQNVKPGVQVGVSEIYRAVETPYAAVICVATQHSPPPPPTPLARQPNNTNLKNDDSDHENFTTKTYSRSFQT